MKLRIVTPFDRQPRRAPRGGAYTLVEMITVIAILGVLLALVLPTATSMWSQRNESATANMLRGLLSSARTQAIRTGERGLFFFVDRQGTQRVVFIEAEPPQPNEAGVVTQRQAVNRFVVMPGKVYTIPTPYRVTPRWALEKALGNTPYQPDEWPVQLIHQRFPFDPNINGADTPRYHRNFFTILFDANGQLVVDRDVLIHDPDSEDDGLGDKTRLPVSDVTEYWTYTDSQGLGSPASVEVVPGVSPALFDMIALLDSRAANFMSVAGLVVYDDSMVEDITPDSVQSVLLLDGQPFYVSRNAGEVILGPKGGQ